MRFKGDLKRVEKYFPQQISGIKISRDRHPFSFALLFVLKNFRNKFFNRKSIIEINGLCFDKSKVDLLYL